MRCLLHTAYCLLASSLHDEPIRVLPTAGLEALGGLSPWRHGMPAAGGLALTAAEWMVHRVHCHAAYMRPLAQPSAPPRFADRDVLVIEVADLADGRHALDEDLADLARRQLHRRVVTLARDELYRGPGAARELAAFAGPQFHVVDLRAERDALERHRVSRQDVDVVAGHDRVAHLEAERLQDVALLAVRVRHERYPRRAIRVVLDRRNLSRDVLLVPLEVDDAVQPLVTAAAPPGGQFSPVVAPARAMQRLGQRAMRLRRRDLVERLNRLEPPAGRSGLVCANRHLRPLQELGHLLAFPELHICLLPVRAAPGKATLALDLSVIDRRANALDLRPEQMLDGAPDVDLVRVRGDPEDQRPVVLANHGGLLGDDRAMKYVGEFHDAVFRNGSTPFLIRLPERLNAVPYPSSGPAQRRSLSVFRTGSTPFLIRLPDRLNAVPYPSSGPA